MHPWCGETVRILKAYGPDGLRIERANGDEHIVPRDWTDLHPDLNGSCPEDPARRLNLGALRDLARWVATRIEISLDETDTVRDTLSGRARSSAMPEELPGRPEPGADRGAPPQQRDHSPDPLVGSTLPQTASGSPDTQRRT